MTKLTKADLENMIEEFSLQEVDKNKQIKELKDQLSECKRDLSNVEIHLLSEERKHKKQLEKRDDYVNRVLARMEGVKALLHIPIQPHDVYFLTNPDMEQLKAEWNKGNEQTDCSKSFTKRYSR